MDRRLGSLDTFLHLLQDALGLGVRYRHRLGVGAEKAGDLGRVLDQMVRLVRHFHAHQHVAGEELALGIDLAAAPDLHHLLGRHENLFEILGEPGRRRLSRIASATFFSKFE
jgi:hypothetical protein